MSEAATSESDVRLYFDEAVAGKRVQADGGSDVTQPGDRFARASRESFEGRLTGRRMDQGNPPWRWLEIGDLTEKPADLEDETIWCEESYIYFLDP